MHHAQNSKRGISLAPIDWTTMVQGLTRSQAFPFALPDRPSLSTLQTHASLVVLTPTRVYKLKKPQDFGFFDYSTPELRRHFCQQEVLLNESLAPQVYLGVAPVLAFPDGQFRFGSTFSPDDAPEPGTICAGGAVVDYAVVMVRLPDTATLESWVRAGTADAPLLAEIARAIASFHTKTLTSEHIAGFGSLEVIAGNWEENFAQMKPYIGRTLDVAAYDCIVASIHHFLEVRAPLFASRVREGHIRDCHGDLRLQHIYILEPTEDPTRHPSRLVLLDRIEFNERFRYGDVASEVAFLAMELDAAGRFDLSAALIDAYIAETRDEALRELLPFYLCYRACVRGKVTSFQLDEPEVPQAQRELAHRQATALFALATRYARGPTSPALVMTGGLMGTGKSTVARALQRELGWALFSSDELRKRLAQLDPAQPRAEAFGQGVYRPEWTERTYHALLTEAGTALAAGRSVLLDASFIRRADRQMLAREAVAHGAVGVFVECVCPRESVLKRLAHRWHMRTEGGPLSSTETSFASDGRPGLYDAQSTIWEDFASDEEPNIQHLVVTTTQPLSVCVEQVLDVLHVPHPI